MTHKQIQKKINQVLQNFSALDATARQLGLLTNRIEVGMLDASPLIRASSLVETKHAIKFLKLGIKSFKATVKMCNKVSKERARLAKQKVADID